MQFFAIKIPIVKIEIKIIGINLFLNSFGVLINIMRGKMKNIIPVIFMEKANKTKSIIVEKPS